MVRQAILALLFVCLWGGLQAQVVISEIVALNGPDGHLTEAGGVFDWIEIHNQGAEEIDLTGYFLTDNSFNLQKWSFGESFPIPAGGFRVVFASERVFVDEPEVHLNFKLSSTNGEYLALVDPDGTTVLSEFAPTFPPLFESVAYGRISGTDTLGILGSPTPNAPNSGGAILPEITNFTSSDPSIAGGGQVSLSWLTANANKVELWVGGSLVSEVGTSGSVTLRPTDNSQYHLVARNAYSEVRSSLDVTVGAAVVGFTAKPLLLAPGGSTVLRWQLTGTDAKASLDGLSTTLSKNPLLFTPSNESVVARDAVWKSVALFPGEGWQEVAFDDAAWADKEAPLDGAESFFRASFTLDDPSELTAYTIRTPYRGNFGLWINGERIADARGFALPVSGQFEYPINADQLRAGENVLSFEYYNGSKPIEIEFTAWRPQSVDTVIPITLTSTNEVGESSMTVEVTVLAEDVVIPPPAALSFTEFFWSYIGTYPTEPFRFFEIYNKGNDAIDLTGYQLGGSATFDFEFAKSQTLGSDAFALVVADHLKFMEIWPGDRPVLGVFEDPQLEGTYDWGVDVRILDQFGRSLERVSSSHLGVLGDLFFPPERVNVDEPENVVENWAVDYEQAGNIGAGAGTPGEGRINILDFSFSPPAALPGDTVTVNWEISGDARVCISEIGEVAGRMGSVSYRVPPDAEFVELTLTAESTFHVFSKRAALILPPRVTNLWSRTAAIKPGDAITFSWNRLARNGPVNHRLDPEVGPIGRSSSVTFTPLVSGFQKNSFWSYFAGDGFPDPDWSSANFSAESWPRGYGVMGFGHPLVTRQLVPSNWVTAYFRKEFYVGELDEIEALYLDLLVDDGVEVHLNGVEVLRDNLPEGPIDGDTPALVPSPDDGMNYRTFEIDPASLVEGKNSIAVGVHNVAADDIDLVFDMALRAQRPVPANGRKVYTLSSANEAETDEVHFTVLFDDPVTLADWAMSHGLVGPPESTDTDGDGLTNLLEYATGSDPNEPSPCPLEIHRNEAGELVFSHPLNLLANPLRVSIEGSNDLALWFPIAAQGSNYVFESALAPDGSTVAEVVSKSYGPAEGRMSFYRLKVVLL